MDKNWYKSHILITAALCVTSWLTTNFVAAHQYISVYWDGTKAIWPEAIKRSVDTDNFLYMLAFFIPLVTVVLLMSSRYGRILWILIALLMCVLPFDSWNDGSKEIIIDMQMFLINSFLLPVLAAATFLVLLIRKGMQRFMKKSRENLI